MCSGNVPDLWSIPYKLLASRRKASVALRTEEGMEAEATLCSPISVRLSVPGHTALGIASGALSPRICRSAQKRQKKLACSRLFL